MYKLVQHFWYSRKTGFPKIKMLPTLRDDSCLGQCNWTITNIQSVLLSLQKNIEMRFSLNLIIIIALMGFIVACKTDPKVANTATSMGKAAPNENPNGVYLDYNIQDVGAIPRDIPKTVTVVIHNNKPDSIQITGTPTTCDCMTIGLQKKVIPSGDTAQMQVTYNARIPGLFEKDVYIDFIGQDSTMRFTMKGHVKQ